MTCIYAGINKAMSFTEKIIFLETIKTAVITIKQRLIFTLAPPEELFSALLKDERFNKSDFFKNAGQLININDFYTGWKKALLNQHFLNSTEKSIITALADILGKSDLETQVKQLEVIIDQLDSIILNQKAKSDDNKKLYTALGVLSALTFTILFL